MDDAVQQQNEELEALRAIYVDDFTLLDAGPPAHFRIRVTQRDTTATLSFRYTSTYPAAGSVDWSLDVPSLSAEHQQRLRDVITERINELRGTPFVFAVVQDVQDQLAPQQSAALSKTERKLKAATSSPYHEMFTEHDTELEEHIKIDLKRKQKQLELVGKSGGGGGGDLWTGGESPPGESASPADEDSLDDDNDKGDDLFGSHEKASPAPATVADATTRRLLHTQAAMGNVVQLPQAPAQGQPATQQEHAAMPPPAHPARGGRDGAVAGKGLRWKMGRLLVESTCVRFMAALNLDNGSLIAIKETKYTGLKATEMAALEKQLRYLQRLSSQSIVPYNGFEWSKGDKSDLLVFLPDLRGGSLEAMLRSFGPVPDLTMLAKYAMQIVHALQYLHDRGVVHNNVSTSTLFLDHKGHLKLADYGCAQTYHRLAVPVDGFPASGAPAEACIRHDVWCMGATLLSAATGPATEMAMGCAPPASWPSLFTTEEARDFVFSAMQCAEQRPSTVTFFLSHPFVCGASTSMAGFVMSTPPSMGIGVPLPAAGSLTTSAETDVSSTTTTTTATNSNHSVALHHTPSPPPPPHQYQSVYGAPPHGSPPADRANALGLSSSSTTTGVSLLSTESRHTLPSEGRAVGPDMVPGAATTATAMVGGIGIPTAMASASRYRTDFEEIEVIGHGGFGEVIKVRNRLDGRYYAVKKVLLDSWDQRANGKILREVTTLSRLHHQFVVRYFQAWIEGSDQEEIEALLARAQEEEEPSADDDKDTDTEDEKEAGGGGGGNGVGGGSARRRRARGDDEDGVGATSKDGDWLSSRSIVFEREGSDDGSAAGSGSSSGNDDDENDDDNHNDDDDDDDDDDNDGDVMATRNNGAAGGADAKELRHQKRLRASAKKGGARHKLVLYIQMEYCERNTLHQIIKGGPLEEDERWRIFRQILEGLNNIHHQGIIHRDLKCPSNIFISKDGNVKIGDFGLATEGGGETDARPALDASREGLSASFSGGADLTIGIGTPFYISPEQLRSGGSYNRKVDMYALGIMLFEMVYPLTTAMERHRVLAALRESITFPPDFETQHPTEAAVVRLLLDHDPKGRPTARQLLDSDMLPSNLDQEIVKEALRTITPDSTTHGDLMRRLFAREPDPRVDYTYDFNSSEQPFALDLSVATMHVTDLVADVARKHGALRVDPTLLMPKRSALLDLAACALLLDEAGQPVALPYDLTVPFARFVAHNKIASLRRFSVGRVYRRNPVGGQPRGLLECDFDVVGPTSHALQHEAETIAFCCDFFESLSMHDMAFCVLLNHTALLDSVLRLCQVRSANRLAALKLFTQAPRHTLEKLTAKIQTDFGLAEPQAALLAQLMSLRGPFAATLTRFRTLLGADRKGVEVYSVLNMQIPARRFDGLVFSLELLKQRQVMAVGGRYDSLLRTFRAQAQDVGAVGVSIALEKVVAQYLASSRKSGRPVPASETEVLVSLVGSEHVVTSLDERLLLCHDLWQWGYRADFVHSDVLTTVDEVQRYARNAGVQVVLFLRRAGVVRMWLAHHRTTMELKRSELRECLREALPVGWQRHRIVAGPFQGAAAAAVPNLAQVGQGVGSASAAAAAPMTAAAAEASSRSFQSGGPTSTSAPSLTTMKAQPKRSESTAHMSTSSAQQQHQQQQQLQAVLAAQQLQQLQLQPASTGDAQSAGAKGSDEGPAYHLLLDVVVLDQQIKGRKAKQLSEMVMRRLTQQLSILASRRAVVVACVDLPLHIVKEMTMLSDSQTGVIHQPVAKYARFKDEIVVLAVFLKKQLQRQVAFVVIWSTKENRWDIFS